MAPASVEDRVFTRCPACQMVFRIPVRFIGHEARCTKCSHTFVASSAGDSKSPHGNLPPPSEDHRSGTQVGDYLVGGVLGRGGMGAVYEARDLRFDRQVALKLLPPETAAQAPEHLQRFLREGKLCATLHHPNVVNVHQVGRDGSLYFIAMELVRGGSASAFLKANGRPLAPRAAVRIIKEVARGLQAAHQHGIVHRDVKPANIMLGDHGLVKLADFGLAKNANTEVSLTGAGGVIGTPSYMSPEQIQGREVDARTDIYSLGATFFCLLIGRPPFYSENPATVLYKHVHEPPPDPRAERADIPEGCCRVIARAMAKDPDRRYRTANDMIADLDVIDFDTGSASSSDDAMSAWLRTVARAQEGTISDPSIFRKRRWQRVRKAVRDWLDAGLGPLVRNRKALVTTAIVASVALALWWIAPSVWDMVGGRIKSFFGK